jgi:hypothetical protein
LFEKDTRKKEEKPKNEIRKGQEDGRRRKKKYDFIAPGKNVNKNKICLHVSAFT